MGRPRRFGALLLLAIWVTPGTAAGADDDSLPPPTLEEQTAPPTARSLPGRVFDTLVDEARRYAGDAVALATAPGSWNGSDWRRAGEVSATLGVLLAADESIDSLARHRRSHFTDRVSGATTWIGGGLGFRVPFALLAGGFAFSDTNVRDMGRDAIEACLMSELLTKGVKRVAGRERPFETDGETTFQPFSSHDSFPSSHTTQAFAIASVIAMRSDGWLVPTLSYTAATLVAFDRINDRVHFSSDVFAGAVVGTVTGRFLVSRHRKRSPPPPRKVRIEILPIPSGLSARVRF